ncbi:type II toxin-antitoxin system VapB family antitoxin [Phenylobacterium sp. 20VBR1]|uniref:Type II toxin-antitoxin system VapB family antitoxin n=1 Tax=Phenylobacterium glaciei TaxID=2803784 RepID=A0A941HXP5_9CAUL|nr:type II toxin-antitoxin system VapB family antitoxin [Phenylobacterium glaciei]MBR7621168.1 type II toxin-antitoxin system VapB family antitoxin [Phenylobacterium glaciei]QQZ49831.1 type II toxin-antitoxin system VapB family antitoxin [Phenylobacterium glaciei]
MAILIKNVDVEKRARELAALTGESLTGAIDEALKLRLALENAKVKPRPTMAEIMAATERFRKAVGLDKRKVNATKQTFDDLWAESEDLDNRP